MEIEYNSTTETTLRRKALRIIRIRIGLVPILTLLIYFLVEFLTEIEWESGKYFVQGAFIGAIISFVFEGIKPKFLYHFLLNEEEVVLFLVNPWGKKQILSIPFSEILKIKFKKKSVSWNFDKLWIHMDKDVKEFHIIGGGIKQNLIPNLNVEIL